MVNLAVLACIVRTTTKKDRQVFEEKVHPQSKSWLWYAKQTTRSAIVLV